MREDIEQPYEGGRDIRARVFELACKVIKCSDGMYALGGAARVMSSQLVWSCTSTAAMLEEARAAESRKDFISKCSIGLKEARETLVRLRLYQATVCGDCNDVQPLVSEADQVVRIIATIVRNSRRRAGMSPNPIQRARIPNS
jgi:four helix bundle protein